MGGEILNPRDIRLQAVPSPGLSPANEAFIYFDKPTLKLKYSVNGGAYADLAGVPAGTVTTAGGTANTLPIWATPTTLADSGITDDGSTVSVNRASLTIGTSNVIANFANATPSILLGAGSSSLEINDATHVITLTASSGVILPTVTTGVWHGTVVEGLYGGTGVANSGKTITLGGNLVTSGAFATTITSTATTNSTLPAGTHSLAPLDSPTFITGLSSPAITDSGLTVGRVVFAGTGGLLSDDADMTFATDTLTVTKLVTNSVNGNTFTAGTYTLTGTAAKTLNFTNTLTLSGTDSSTLNIGAGGTLGSNAFTSTAYAPLASPTFTGTVTLPAVTLGGTVSGGGQQLNNIIIGTTTPLAGSFTALTATGATITGSVTETAASPIYNLNSTSTSSLAQFNFQENASGVAVIEVFGSAYATADLRQSLVYNTNNAGTKHIFFINSAEVARLSSAGLLLGAGTAVKNIRHGISGAMVLGTVTVTDAGCTANTRYFFSAHALGTVSLAGGYYASTRNAGTSFVITSSQATETSTIDWVAVEP